MAGQVVFKYDPVFEISLGGQCVNKCFIGSCFIDAIYVFNLLRLLVGYVSSVLLMCLACVVERCKWLTLYKLLTLDKSVNS